MTIWQIYKSLSKRERYTLARRAIQAILEDFDGEYFGPDDAMSVAYDYFSADHKDFQAYGDLALKIITRHGSKQAKNNLFRCIRAYNWYLLNRESEEYPDFTYGGDSLPDLDHPHEIIS